MEVTTVAPSPAAHTKGDNLCEVDVTNVAIHSVTLLISLCGLVGNGAVLCLLSLKFHNTGIFDLAFTDFFFLLFTFPSALLFLLEDISCSPLLPLLYLSFLFKLSVASYYWALFQLTRVSSLVDTVKFCILCYFSDLPLRLLWLVYRFQYWVCFALFTVIPAVTILCPSNQQKHCRAALISTYAIIVLIFAAPMLISSTISFIMATWGSKKQQPKQRDVVIFLILLFILLLSLCHILQQLGYTVVSPDVFFLLNCIHSSIKPFIYFLAGRCWRPCALRSLRLSLQRVFDELKEETAHSNDAPKDMGV